MTDSNATPQHTTLTPDEAARLIWEREHSADPRLNVETIAAVLREHTDEFGPSETEIDGTLYTVQEEGA